MNYTIGLSFAFMLAAFAQTVRSQTQAVSAQASDSFNLWRHDLNIRPLLPETPYHSLHSYFGVNPESPDERWVVAYISDRPDAQIGKLVQIERQTSRVLTIDSSVEVEDAHRQANQQWVCNGQYIIYMKLVADEWQIVRADSSTQEKVILARGRQLGWGQPNLDFVPLYGLHWNPGQHRDLELLNVRTGEISTVLLAEQVMKDHSEYVAKKFGQDSSNLSIFFPTLSPDGQRVIFKLAKARGGNFRSGKASIREGLFAYDLKQNRSCGPCLKWDHPAWCSDSRHVQNMQQLIDTENMSVRDIEGLPKFNVGVHASTNPDGKLLAADVIRESYLPDPQCWNVLILHPVSGQWHIIKTAPVAGHGTTSWRPAHPHPSFNARGNRLYFNMPLGNWTSLYVAEIPLH